ncbi:ABC transporter substrate-binding protein [Glycomyces sp. NRRL B-16210]|uniref:ABC transporter substrate-binding protein n=1 Tax=Glycomyces sp. NRRL B-16210 TaxID=1463821 RepID=UPI0009DC9E91|nr:ABC transporter substrate-binding protein [Glycomyces sp. NRRL B-16210]
MALTRRAFGGLTIGGSSALMLAACSSGDDGGDTEASGELVWAVSSPWEAWNSTTSTGNNSVGNQAMVPMNPRGRVGYEFDPEGNVFYDDALFEGEPELISEAPMQVQLTLKENAQWSDGKPVRVEDFIFYWYCLSGNPEFANQEKAIPASTAWGETVESIEAGEGNTVVITYIEGKTDPEWPFTGGVYLPSHFAEENGFENWQSDPEVMGDAIAWFNENLWTVVTGPYKPVDSKLGEFIIYEPNENYQGSTKPLFSKLTIKPVTGLEAEVTELRQGTIAGCWPSDFSLEELQKLDENPEEWKYETYAGATWSHIDINVGNSFLKDVALRRAVFTIIDIEELNARVFPGTEIPWLGNHFFTEASGYYEDYTTPANYGKGDVDAAKAHLSDAGYTWDGDEKLISPDGTPVAFNFRFATANEIRKLTGEILQAQFEPLGIDLELKGFADDDFAGTLSSSDFDIIVFSWVGSPAFTGGPSQFFSTSSSSNYGGYDDPVINELLPQITATFDLDEAADLANQVSAQVIDQAYTLPLYSSPLSIIWNAALVEGPGVNPASQAGPLWNLREWKKP